jgi:hypothetical protein
MDDAHEMIPSSVVVGDGSIAIDGTTALLG